jgi:hypothetical protein
MTMRPNPSSPPLAVTAKNIRLLALKGGGVRGLSSLMILRSLMKVKGDGICFRSVTYLYVPQDRLLVLLPLFQVFHDLVPCILAARR